MFKSLFKFQIEDRPFINKSSLFETKLKNRHISLWRVIAIDFLQLVYSQYIVFNVLYNILIYKYIYSIEYFASKHKE